MYISNILRLYLYVLPAVFTVQSIINARVAASGGGAALDLGPVQYYSVGNVRFAAPSAGDPTVLVPPIRVPARETSFAAEPREHNADLPAADGPVAAAEKIEGSLQSDSVQKEAAPVTQTPQEAVGSLPVSKQQQEQQQKRSRWSWLPFMSRSGAAVSPAEQPAEKSSPEESVGASTGDDAYTTLPPPAAEEPDLVAAESEVNNGEDQEENTVAPVAIEKVGSAAGQEEKAEPPVADAESSGEDGEHTTTSISTDAESSSSKDRAQTTKSIVAEAESSGEDAEPVTQLTGADAKNSGEAKAKTAEPVYILRSSRPANSSEPVIRLDELRNATQELMDGAAKQNETTIPAAATPQLVRKPGFFERARKHLTLRNAAIAAGTAGVAFTAYKLAQTPENYDHNSITVADVSRKYELLPSAKAAGSTELYESVARLLRLRHIAKAGVLDAAGGVPAPAVLAHAGELGWTGDQLREYTEASLRADDRPYRRSLQQAVEEQLRPLINVDLEANRLRQLSGLALSNEEAKVDVFFANMGHGTTVEMEAIANQFATCVVVHRNRARSPRYKAQPEVAVYTPDFVRDHVLAHQPGRNGPAGLCEDLTVAPIELWFTGRKYLAMVAHSEIAEVRRTQEPLDFSARRSDDKELLKERSFYAADPVLRDTGNLAPTFVPAPPTLVDVGEEKERAVAWLDAELENLQQQQQHDQQPQLRRHGSTASVISSASSNIFDEDFY